MWRPRYTAVLIVESWYMWAQMYSDMYKYIPVYEYINLWAIRLLQQRGGCRLLKTHEAQMHGSGSCSRFLFLGLDRAGRQGDNLCSYAKWLPRIGSRRYIRSLACYEKKVFPAPLFRLYSRFYLPSLFLLLLLILSQIIQNRGIVLPSP